MKHPNFEKELSDFVTKRTNLAFQYVDLQPKAKMKLMEFMSEYVSSQVKLAVGVGCNTLEDYVTKVNRAGDVIFALCAEDVLECTCKEDVVALAQKKMHEIWGINLTDEEQIAHALFQELLMVPFTVILNTHTANIMVK